MTTLGDLAEYVRSKNAGPFWVTVDIFCGDEKRFRRIQRAPSLAAEAVAALYGAPASDILFFPMPELRVLKISFPRPRPQGAPGDADSHAGQAFVPLLSAVIP